MAASVGAAAAFGVSAIGVSPAGAAPVVPATATPIQHLVVIFQENVSFDHYFGTYPYAANTDGTPWANPADTSAPPVDGLYASTSGGVPTGPLLSANPNAANPARYANTSNTSSPATVVTCDKGHNYADEQTAFNGGSMNRFVQSVGTASGSNPVTKAPCNPNEVMNYYDGNTVTGLWNYARNYAMSDNSYGTTFGPSSPGAINLVSGNTGRADVAHEAKSPSIATNPATATGSPNADLTPDGLGGYSLTSDAQPYWDDCSTRDAVGMSGQNVGDQLTAAGLSWGWFQGGFRPTTSFAAASAAVNPGQPTSTFTPDQFSGSFAGKVVPPNASNQALCDAVHPVGAGLPSPGTGTGQYGYKDDYIAHHEPFQYYANTANPHHLTVPTDASGNDTVAGLQEIGTDTQTFSGGSYGSGSPQFNTPNHNYDSSDFDQLVAAIGHGTLPATALPAVSFLKAPGYQDGHAAYSDPIDEQEFVAREVNALMQTSAWASTAVVINYDDSDGWYDHAFATGAANPSTLVPVNPSSSPADNLFNSTSKAAYTFNASTNPMPTPVSTSCTNVNGH